MAPDYIGISQWPLITSSITVTAPLLAHDKLFPMSKEIHSIFECQVFQLVKTPKLSPLPLCPHPVPCCSLFFQSCTASTPVMPGSNSYIHLSAGELLRRERESGSSDGQLIDEYIREGRIVPVAITLGLLKKAMQTSGPGSRFLIDGFPRNDDNRQASESLYPWAKTRKATVTGYVSTQRG